ncbi:MAG: oligosaccharide flippase family protein, partial [Bacteroidaceae bacterium]|nr:oligosaccharide flippase family protein [Bacteroidaceae bacterium]
MINGVSYLLALITMPYLIRVLGEEKYGAYLFIYTVAQYLLLVGNYGFRYSVTRQVSVHRDNKERVN